MKNIFVGNLDFASREDDLQKLFGAFGTVASITMGPVSSAEALALSHAVAPLLFERETVVLDFSGVHAVDGGGLGTSTLLQLYVRSSGRSLHYCGLKRRVNDAIERTGLNTVFSIYRSEEEAATRIGGIGHSRQKMADATE